MHLHTTDTNQPDYWNVEVNMGNFHVQDGLALDFLSMIESTRKLQKNAGWKPAFFQVCL